VAGTLGDLSALVTRLNGCIGASALADGVDALSKRASSINTRSSGDHSCRSNGRLTARPCDYTSVRIHSRNTGCRNSRNWVCNMQSDNNNRRHTLLRKDPPRIRL
jgi:hypothetical protein